MSVSWQQLDPVVDIALEDGTHRRLLLELDNDGVPVEVAESPDEGFPSPLVLGDSPQYNSDQRTRKTVFRDWRRGMGRDEYEETQGVNDFRDSQCDTRFTNVLVCRPLPVRLGSSTTVNTASSLAKIVPVTGGNAAWFAYCNGGTAKYYSTATTQWVATSLTNGSDFYDRGPGGNFYIWDIRQKISQSDDGVTWNTVAITDIDAASATVALNVWGLALHDNKLFTMSKLVASGNSYALFQSVDATTAPTTATWQQLGTLVLDKDELVGQLAVWKFPPDPGRPGLFCLTNRRIYYYDDTADAASPTAWKRWHEWDTPYANNGQGHLVVHGGTGDLYAMPNFTQDRLWQFTGSTIAGHSPGEKGGLPASRQHSIAWTMTNSRGLYCWLQANPPYTGVITNRGMVVALTEQDGWHHIFDTLNTGVVGSNKFVAGGGVNDKNILTVLDDGTVWVQELYDTAYPPQYAATARSYDSDPLYHITGKTDVGTPTLSKAGLYAEVNAKIPTGASVAVAYRLDDSDGTGSFTTMGTLADTTPMPARLGFGNNVRFRQCELKLTLTRGTATNATPIVYATILHTALIVPARYVFQLRVDLRRARYKNAPKQFAGYGINSARTWVRNLHGQIASFTCGQPGDEITVSRAQVSVTPIEGPDGTGGRYLLQFRGLETPTSGS